MLLIFGFRTKVELLGLVWLTCRSCGYAGHNQLTKEVTRLSLFFIPLVPVRTRYVMHCACGTRETVSGAEARRLLAAGRRAPL